ncbi:MAG TPA: hypothetical protein VLV55_14740 [Rhizomicrobium sp.]|nr:hypothetical protein [Rhizomicrobium sp.]
MRQRNTRLIAVGIVLIILAIGFFFVMMGMAPKSNDPKSMMETVGQASGAVGGIAIVMVIFGLIGKKKQA